MNIYQTRIKELREDNDITQTTIAEFLKTSKQQYSLYETGKRNLPIDMLVKLALYYEVSADYILGLPKGLKWLR